MSSIQSFLRQRHQTTSYIDAPANDCYYIFVPASGNYVGNYPPGYLQKTSAIPADKGTLLRDMGKTIKAPIGVSGVVDPNATAGFFRAVQFIFPVASVSATGSTTFGVGIGSAGAGTLPTAGNAGDTGYGTYYIPVIVDGTLATSAGTQATVATQPQYGELNGQM
jgi:hypothetical protein